MRSAKLSCHRKILLHGESREPVDPAVIRSLLAKNGAMDTASLAKEVNRNGRGMTSAMRALERQGIVVKNGQGKGVTWSLPVATEIAEAPAGLLSH
jgi:predicted HTH transcriptional regulator